MKRGTELKLKFRLLKKRLDLPLWQAKGLLQTVWDFTSENAERGDIGRFTNAEIALAVEYEGDADELIEVLVECRWLDRHPRHRLIVHNWKEHAEEWLRKRLLRAGGIFAVDDPLEDEGVALAAADAVRQRQTVADNGGQRPTTADNGGPPSHSHSHSHSLKPENV